jgi:hypothetical protein
LAQKAGAHSPQPTFQEITVKLHNTLIISCGLFIAAQVSFAQSASLYYGIGTAVDASSRQQIDTFGTGIPYTTPRLGGSFSDIGTTLLFTKHFGVGADVSWKNSRGAYAGLLYRPLFYNFDAVFEPVSAKHFEPEFHAGMGAEHIGFSLNNTKCDQFAGCSTSNVGVDSSTHFQVHGVAAARFYVNDHVFLRPAVDAHWVNNNFQFGHNWVPEYSFGIGYSFGRE